MRCNPLCLPTMHFIVLQDLTAKRPDGKLQNSERTSLNFLNEYHGEVSEKAQ